MVVIPKFQKDLWDIEKGPITMSGKVTVILRLLVMSDTKLLLLLF